MAAYSSILAWRIPWTEESDRLIVHGVAKSRTRLSDFTHSLDKIYMEEKTSHLISDD